MHGRDTLDPSSTAAKEVTGLMARLAIRMVEEPEPSSACQATQFPLVVGSRSSRAGSALTVIHGAR